ncbi:pectate lyase [Sphingomonas sp. G-3-2-10]|uniref:pectate lyase family protein n=1 Tax=Sphingomonas sp. G-3-2-10 TaxID=2728838 RepID=UPI00146B7F83|nr:pectate lyase [Sphingomonas sp. G-3-2-10]NML04394.1 pectate lyase [Sphingomonas sp. G-3-2-10]
MRSVTMMTAALTLLGSEAAAQTTPLAFPGAEGAGAHSLGGRGGRVFTVTSLADAGAGTLREAVEARGPRTVVFAVAGTIRLVKPLKIVEPRITIAGQTAPGGGITLRDQPLLIHADDVVVRFIRSRLGDESKVEADAVSITGGERIILDHVSASWSVDETLSVGAPGTDPEKVVRDVTVQWSIIGESLNRSGHAKGAHGYGSLLRSGFGAEISLHHNLWAHHRARMPRPGNYNDPAIDPDGPIYDIRANVFYNWAGSHAGYNADKTSRANYNFVGNAYLRGPDSKGAIAFEESSTGGRAWFARNSMDGAVPADPWSLVAGLAASENRLTAPIATKPVRDDPAALDRVLAGAGASLFRDAVDTRIVASVRAKGGVLIDSQTQVGGWPELPAGKAAPDGDGDGMPDAWERAHGLDPRNAADGNADRNRDGVTNLEDWLADAAAGKR